MDSSSPPEIRQEDGAGQGGYAKESSKEFQEVPEKRKKPMKRKKVVRLPVSKRRNSMNADACYTDLYFELWIIWRFFFGDAGGIM